MLPSHDSDGYHYVMLVDSKLRVHMYPESPKSRDYFKNHNDTLFFYIVDTKENVARGYVVTNEVQ